MRNSELKGRFAEDGFQILPAVISDAECNLLASELSGLFLNQQKSAETKIGGIRNLLRNPRVEAIVSSTKLKCVLKELAGKSFFPVRAIFFDKTPESNWRVPWHQDLAIAVAKKIETPGFAGWSIKEGVLHVHPPSEILENMLAIRLHLDECGNDNGALKVIPGSHGRGKLDAKQVDKFKQTKAAVVCEVPKGGALLMRLLLLHSSSSAQNPSHRRVLHIEFASDELPNGLKWFERQ